MSVANLSSYPPVERNHSLGKAFADDPTRALQMGPPAGFRVLGGRIEVHQGRCGFTPVATRGIGLEQRRVQREMLAVVSDCMTSWRFN